MTVELSSAKAMQFSQTLERLLFQIGHANPCYSPVHKAKVDQADGLCNLWLAEFPTLAWS
jgi:hypothetical protein